MKRIFLFLMLLFQATFLCAQGNRINLSERIDTTNIDYKLFAENIVQKDSANLDKAKSLLNWVSNSLEWVATDYEQRTVNEILWRGKGNCFELAKVYMALIRALNIKYRPIAEINIQTPSDERQESAGRGIAEYGNKMSLFGKQHNDHRWLEVHDPSSNEWIPVDPTMNVIGVEQWLKARVWFGKRVTIDTSITNAMIVPFAIFVTDSSKSNMLESRTDFYLAGGFDDLYNNELSKLPSWNFWISQVDFLQKHARSTFEGKENLHNYTHQIAELAQTYQNLKKEYADSQKHKRKISVP